LARLVDFIDHALAAPLVHFSNGNFSAFRCEQFCHCFADVSARAGDDRYLSSELHGVIPFSKNLSAPIRS
jgi:hypothetical protein